MSVPFVRPMLLAAVLLCGAGAPPAPAAEGWFELKTPNFRVVSEASEARTRDWAVEFELVCRGLTQLVPVDTRYRDRATLILFRSDRNLRSIVGKEQRIAGFAGQRDGAMTIAISIDGARDDVREIVYPAAVYWHLTAAERRLPTWLEIGVSEVFTTFHLNGSSFDLGANRPSLYRHLRAAGPLPFERLVKLEHDDLRFSGADLDHTRRVHAQAWMTTHALLFGKEGIGWPALAEYIKQAPQRADPAEDLEQSLGLSAAELDRRLAEYLRHGESKPINIPFDRSAVETGFVTRPMDSWEVELALGNLLVAAGEISTAEGYLARATLAAPNDAAVKESLAALRLATKDYDDAAAYARDAIAGGRDGYYNHFLLAAAAVQNGAMGFNGEEVAANLVRALERNPRFLPGYELLGDIAAELNDRTPAANQLLLDAGAKFRGSFSVQLGCALLAAQLGKAEQAEAHLKAAKALVTAPESRRAKRHAEAAEEVAKRLARQTVSS